MAKQVINIGTRPNSKDGDAIRDAFNKVNQNFNELYAITSGTVEGITELAQDYAAQMLISGVHSGITVDYDDVNNRLNLSLADQISTDLTGNVFSNNSTLLVDAVNGTIPYSVISGAPSLAAVASTGSFADLINTPTTLAGYGITDSPVDISDLSDTQNLLGQAAGTSLAHVELRDRVTTTGSLISFTKEPNTSTTDPIDTDLELTRPVGIGAGLINIALESSWNTETSPAGTEWNWDGWANLDDVKLRTYSNLRQALRHRIGENIVGAELVMHDIANDKYYKMQFSSWAQGPAHTGAFAYTRQLIDTSTVVGLNFADGSALVKAPKEFVDLPQIFSGDTNEYILGLADRGKHVYAFTESVIRIPTDAQVNFPIGSTIFIVTGVFAANKVVKVSCTAPTTIEREGSAGAVQWALKPYSTSMLIKVSENKWNLSGGIDLSNYALNSAIPDVSNFITSNDVPTDVSELTDTQNLLEHVDLSAIDQSIIPDTDVAYDLGSPTNRFRDLYLSGNTINLGGIEISNIGGSLITSSPIVSTSGIQNVTPSKGTGARAVTFNKKSDWNGSVVQVTNLFKRNFVSSPDPVGFVARTLQRVTTTAVENSTTITLDQGSSLATPPLKSEWFTWFKGVWSSSVTYERGQVVTFSATNFPIPTQDLQVGLYAVAKRTVLNVNPNTVSLTTNQNGMYNIAGGESDDWEVYSYINNDPDQFWWRAPWQNNNYDSPWWHPEYQLGGTGIEAGMKIVLLDIGYRSKTSYYQTFLTSQNDITVQTVNGNQITLSEPVTLSAGQAIGFQKILTATRTGIVGQDQLIDGVILYGGFQSSFTAVDGVVPNTPPDASIPTTSTIPFDGIVNGINMPVGLVVTWEPIGGNRITLGVSQSYTTVSGDGWSYPAVVIDINDEDYPGNPGGLGYWAWANLQGGAIRFQDPGTDANIYALVPDPIEPYEYGLVINPGKDYFSDDLPSATVVLYTGPQFSEITIPSQSQPAISFTVVDNKLRFAEFSGGLLLNDGTNNSSTTTWSYLTIQERPLIITDVTAPVNLSDLENDAGYITLEELPIIPVDISDLTDSEGLLGQGGGAGPIQPYLELTNTPFIIQPVVLGTPVTITEAPSGINANFMVTITEGPTLDVGSIIVSNGGSGYTVGQRYRLWNYNIGGPDVASSIDFEVDTVGENGEILTIINAAFVGSASNIPGTYEFVPVELRASVFDQIGPGLTITRDYQQGIYNIEVEQEYDNNTYLSPLGTEWNSEGWGDLLQLGLRSYTTWRQALNNRVGNEIVASELVMHDIANDKYYKFDFHTWGGSNGGYSYTRTEVTDPNYFRKPHNAGNDAVDIIEDDSTLQIGITRTDSTGIYNPFTEQGFSNATSPAGTTWNADGWDDLSDLTTRTYTNFDAAAGGYNSVLGKKFVMYVASIQKYYAIQFYEWATNGDNNFAYVRYEIDETKLNEGIAFPDGTRLKSAEGLGRIKSTAAGDRRIEEVTGYNQVSVTSRNTNNYTGVSSRNITTNYEIWVTRTPELDAVFQPIFDNGGAEISISFDNVTYRSAFLSSIETTEYRFYYNNFNEFVPQTQGDNVYIEIITGADPVVWWDKADLPGGSQYFRGAVIDYHAYTGESTIIGSIHIIDDDGENYISHQEVQSGSTDGENDDLWLVTSEGQIRYRRIDGESKTLKIHWTAKVFYGSELYD